MRGFIGPPVSTDMTDQALFGAARDIKRLREAGCLLSAIDEVRLTQREERERAYASTYRQQDEVAQIAEVLAELTDQPYERCERICRALLFPSAGQIAAKILRVHAADLERKP